MATNEAQPQTPVLAAEGVTVTYADQPALDAVNFSVYPGEVHALIGHNGAGKSTLAACLTGRLIPDQGRVIAHGRVALVTQHPQVIPDQPVAMSVWLGHEPRRWFGVSRSKAIEQTHALAASLSLDLGALGIDPAQPGRALDQAQRHVVALLAALSWQPRILIADEATAGARAQDRRLIADLLAVVARSGVGVVMITHYADEVVQVADRMTVVHQARALPAVSVNGLDVATVRHAMAGDLTALETLEYPIYSKQTHENPSAVGGEAGIDGEIPSAVDQEGSVPRDRVALGRPWAFKGLAVWAHWDNWDNRDNGDDGDATPIASREPVVFTEPGKVSVILGAPGDGTGPLIGAITGVAAPPGWVAYLNAQRLTGLSLAARRAHGLGWVPGDRTTNGPAPGLSIAENLAMAFPGQPVADHPSPDGNDGEPVVHATAEGTPADRGAAPPGQAPRAHDDPEMDQPVWRWGVRHARGLGQATRNLLTRWRALRAIPGRRPVGQLSGGQAQAVMVGRELEANPAAILLTNPQHGMDPGAMADLAHTLKAKAADGMAVLVTTTDRTFAQMVGDRFWRASAGTIRPIDPLPPPPDTSTRTSSPVATRKAVPTLPGPLLALALGLVVAALIIGLWGANPAQVASDLVQWAWGNPAGMRAVFAHLVPLLVIAAGVAIMFRADVISIGAEGQLYLGALTAGLIAQSTLAPGPVVIMAAMVGGALAGVD